MLNRILRLVIIELLFSSHGNSQSSTSAEALALEQHGKLEEAAIAWRSITQGNSKDAAAFASLGVVLAKQQKYREAITSYKKALALNPKLLVSISTWASPNSNRGTSPQPSPRSKRQLLRTPPAPSPASCWA
jgi:tetratricopeptide (TPR) repeat protein